MTVTRPNQVRGILSSIGDREDLRIHEQFGPLSCHWRFYGGHESNMSTINLGSKSGRSLVERITNAFDAVLEKQMHIRKGNPPNSPFEAAKKWFGRPPSDIDSGIFTWKDYRAEDRDRYVHVVLTSGDEEISPTIDIKDDGIGIEPQRFPDTILSLHRGNKIKKKYLAGAFGQGGSATFSFCKYTLIISRHVDKPSKIGFTLVKLMNLGDDYSENAYAYLAVGDPNDPVIPNVDIDPDKSLPLYSGGGYSGDDNEKSLKLRTLSTGTIVRHYGYRLEGNHKTLSPSPGNLYHLLHYMLFDPVVTI